MQTYRNGGFICSMDDYLKVKHWIDSYEGEWLRNSAWNTEETGVSKAHLIAGQILKESSEWMKWTRNSGLWVRKTGSE